MKKYFYLLGSAILFWGLFGCSRASLVLSEGNLSFLKGENLFNVKYVYDDLKVGDKSEKEYVDEKVKEKNESEPGKGDKWLKEWYGNREAKFQPKFEELLNEYAQSKAEFKSGLENTKYTLVLKTTTLEPGWNVWVSRKDAEIDAVALFVETDNPDKILAVFQIEDCRGGTGGGFDFDVATRLQESYALAGKELANYIIAYL